MTAVTGVTRDGGFTTHILADASALAQVPGQRTGVWDAAILDTFASIDGMVFVRDAFELAAYRSAAGEKVLTVTQREPARGCYDAEGAT